MKTVSIVNATSYTALELLQMIAVHPEFRLVSATARSAVGKRLVDIFPQLLAVLPPPGGQEPAFDPQLVLTETPEPTDITFVCLPHAAAAETILELLKTDTKIVDLSADFRLKDADVYQEWYKHVHPAPELLTDAVFGLPELYRAQIKQARLVANPGCHSTTAILALSPFFAAGLLEPDVIVDSKTGVSGAGRTPSVTTMFSEVTENFNAYSLNGHRHQAEITQEAAVAAERGGFPLASSLRLTFLPHLVPMTRGILASVYANLTTRAQGMTTMDMVQLMRDYYRDEPFVHIVEQTPQTKWTYGSNHSFIYPYIETRTNRLVVLSVLDNLRKGAAGQAIQNANLLAGLPETMGLTQLGVNP